MEEGNLISFGKVLKISVIKIKPFENTDGKLLQTAGKINFCKIFLLLKNIYLRLFFLGFFFFSEISPINISMLKWKHNIQKEKVVWMCSAA